MKVDIYFTHSFVNVDSPIMKIKGQGSAADTSASTKTTTKEMYEKGWRLAHAVKTAQSAQLESFNFLLIFEK
jgi:hypothetical protein|tara:strand:- start:128 stop:343 length:216 start_codon:yes stop_codon:yes gene_type:complete